MSFNFHAITWLDRREPINREVINIDTRRGEERRAKEPATWEPGRTMPVFFNSLSGPFRNWTPRWLPRTLFRSCFVRPASRASWTSSLTSQWNFSSYPIFTRTIVRSQSIENFEKKKKKKKKRNRADRNSLSMNITIHFRYFASILSTLYIRKLSIVYFIHFLGCYSSLRDF